VADQRQAPRLGRVLGGVRPTNEDHRATTVELLFDLVYVFALTQVTGYMGRAHSAHGVLQGLLLLALLWWTWSAYTWLGNQARADEGFSGRPWPWRWQRCSWSPSPSPRPGRKPPAA
jgi:low temperature requirement protein LtrA